MSGQGYLVREPNGSYLEWVPADRRFEWLAGSSTFATVFTLGAASTLADQFEDDGATVEPDLERRVPTFGIGDLPCEDREPRDVTFDEALGHVTGLQERQEAARRLK